MGSDKKHIFISPSEIGTGVVDREAVLSCFEGKIILPADIDIKPIAKYIQSVIDEIMKLPSAVPERSCGKWECSKKKCEICLYTWDQYRSGVDMRESEEQE